MTMDEAKLLFQRIFLSLDQRLFEKVECKHDRIEINAGNTASILHLQPDDAKRVKDKLGMNALFEIKL